MDACRFEFLSGLPQAYRKHKRHNIVVLIADDTGRNDFGVCSGGGVTLGHPTPNVDHTGKESVVLRSWGVESNPR